MRRSASRPCRARARLSARRRGLGPGAGAGGGAPPGLGARGRAHLGLGALDHELGPLGLHDVEKPVHEAVSRRGALVHVAHRRAVVDGRRDGGQEREGRGAEQRGDAVRLGVEDGAHPEDEVVVDELGHDLRAQHVARKRRRVLVVRRVQVDHQELELALRHVDGLAERPELRARVYRPVVQFELVEEALALGPRPPRLGPEQAQRRGARERHARRAVEPAFVLRALAPVVGVMLNRLVARPARAMPAPAAPTPAAEPGCRGVVIVAKRGLDRRVELPGVRLQARDAAVHVVPAGHCLSKPPSRSGLALHPGALRAGPHQLPHLRAARSRTRAALHLESREDFVPIHRGTTVFSHSDRSTPVSWKLALQRGCDVGMAVS